MDTLLQVTASWILPALFFWFLFSFIAMTIIEFIQNFRKSRQKGLEEAIKKLLGKEFTVEFYKHALVNPLEDNKPSYISRSLFAKVVMEWLLTYTKVKKPTKKYTLNEIIQKNIQAIAQKDTELGDVLKTIVDQADLKTDKDSEFLDLVQKDLEIWFIEAVSIWSSVYGRRLQLVTILVSLVVAAVANFDVIDITVRLWTTSKYPELQALNQTPQFDINQFIMLPVGWYSNYLPSNLTEWILKIVGIYLGAFFIAIGSQFAYNLAKGQYQPRE